MRKAFASEYCPKCLEHLKAGRGDLLDPYVWNACQRVMVEEAEYQRRVATGEEATEGGGARYSPEQAWRALLGLPPKKSDEDVDVERDFGHLRHTEQPMWRRERKGRVR